MLQHSPTNRGVDTFMYSPVVFTPSPIDEMTSTTMMPIATNTKINTTNAPNVTNATNDSDDDNDDNNDSNDNDSEDNDNREKYNVNYISATMLHEMFNNDGSSNILIFIKEQHIFTPKQWFLNENNNINNDTYIIDYYLLSFVKDYSLLTNNDTTAMMSDHMLTFQDFWYGFGINLLPQNDGFEQMQSY